MPFVTEELWQRLPAPQHYPREKCIMICKYPSLVECWTNERVEYEMGMVESTVSDQSKRTYLQKKEMKVSRTDQIVDLLRRHEMEVSTLANLSSFTVFMTLNKTMSAKGYEENLNKTMSAKGYEEKVPAHVKEENVSKLATLMQQLLSIEEAAQHFEREAAAKASALQD
ncbi:Aminoacyl-tRNA synthetase, class 1a, anticodon-binding [Cynara cardunculus var. scolymus]|uniref:valine--tRNA ligase n=1 Tax=Cynara cardunculus var. scolymus TaxID=59895 RepID=A0A118JX55_CYNCS|nr:Aminoacyl-tRNA synthetase, class 1a, anticodon-binding [Cynara cardunculus var. scolymus]